MKTYFVLALFAFVGCASTPAPTPVADYSARKTAAAAQLDAWHEAASQASEVRYFDEGMVRDGVFLGTDPNERWTREEFRAYAKPHFAKGKGWSLKSKHRWLSFNSSVDTAWFDESLESREMGAVRGSGVMVWEEGRWKMAQYNLSYPVPNDDFDAVRKLIDTKKSPAKKTKPSGSQKNKSGKS